MSVEIHCTHAYRLWAEYIHLLAPANYNAVEADEARRKVCDLVTSPPPPPNRIGFARGDLAFVHQGKRHWFAHKNARRLPLLIGFFVEGGDPFAPVDCPAVMEAALAEDADIRSQAEIDQMAGVTNRDDT